MTWSDDPKIWQMACEMCAMDTCFWSTYDSLTQKYDGLALCINVNDVFAPAADAEEIAPADVAEVYALFDPDNNDPLMDWVGKRRGMTPHAWRKP